MNHKWSDSLTSITTNSGHKLIASFSLPRGWIVVREPSSCLHLLSSRRAGAFGAKKNRDSTAPKSIYIYTLHIYIF